MHIFKNKEVDRYFRVFLSIATYSSEDEYTKSMSNDQLSAVITLGSFSIDIDEETYNKFFGYYFEEEFDYE